MQPRAVPGSVIFLDNFAFFELVFLSILTRILTNMKNNNEGKYENIVLFIYRSRSKIHLDFLSIMRHNYSRGLPKLTRCFRR